MPSTVTNESKNSATVTNEAKQDNDPTWADYDETWGETGPAGDTWAKPGSPLTKETKNTVSVTNESKS